MQMTDDDPQFHSARARFQHLYGAGEVQAWRAPARLNILGEHVDYVSYLPTASLPFASHEYEMVMLYRANQHGEVRGASLTDRFPPFRFALAEGWASHQQSWLEYLYQQPTPAPHWQNYVKGAVFFVQQQHALSTATGATGFDFVVTSTIPPQGGSSSSSALVVLAGAVFREINGLAIDRIALARESAQAEWHVGTRGGALDQTTICLAERQHAVHLRYADNRAELVPLPATGYRWVTFFSHAADKGREVLHEYNERAAVARLLIPAWLNEHCAEAWAQAVQSDDHRRITALLELLPAVLTPAELATQFPATYHECQRLFPVLLVAGHQLPLRLRPRALHHWGEVRRVREAVQQLRQDSAAAMQKLGELLLETHASLRDLYEVSTPLVNQLHAILVAHPGVHGARLIGGGFGGNVLALTKEEAVADLLAHVQKEFYAPQNRDARAEGAVMISTPGDGLAKLF